MKASDATKLQKANDLLTEAQHLVSEVHDARESYVEERTEAWQEGEKGDAFIEINTDLDNCRVEVEAQAALIEEILERP